jgi:hypothetical protein
MTEDEGEVELVQDEKDFRSPEIPYMEDPVAQRVVAFSFLLKAVGPDNADAVEKAIALMGAVITSVNPPDSKLRTVK